MVVFDIKDVPRIHQGSYISIFRSLPSWKGGGQTNVQNSKSGHTQTRTFWLFNVDVTLISDFSFL